MLQKLFVDVILQVLEDLFGVLLIVLDPLFNSTVIIIYLFNTILSLFAELLLLVHDINFVFFLPILYLVDFALELLKVLFNVTINRL